MIAVLVVASAVAIGLLWLVYWRKQTKDWDLLLKVSAINREKLIQASIASDPLGIFRAVIQVVGVVLAVVLTAL